MAVLNVTPDSFYDGGKYTQEKKVMDRVGQMLIQGADIIDIGGMSSRPGAEIISVEEEKRRVLPHIRNILQSFPETIISIDTVHGEVARAAVNEGASIINDISAGTLDASMYDVVGELNVPYVLMHMQGKPGTMQDAPQYIDPVQDILDFFAKELTELEEKGRSLERNNCLNMIALQNGAGILRVHDEIINLIDEVETTEENRDYLESEKGRALNNLGDYQEALDVLLPVNERENGTNARTNYRIAYAYCYLGEYEEALGYADRGIELDPDYASAYQALSYFNQYLEIDPEDEDCEEEIQKLNEFKEFHSDF
ncbi:dihydropteroate synthase-like [Penaeus monodon]|uniref:dihydropteroate synthase-like n=1 Tax=Penaeus monodon TaxID=6687 RepID=UPI0018A70023|nr:dihydropteroate synthase-like [Penaeus monodon]